MKTIPVLFTTNNNGISHYEVVASSICETLDKDYQIKLYCIYENGSKDIWRIERLKKIYSNIKEVILINYEETFGEIEGLPNPGSWPNVIYYSLVAEKVIKEAKYIFLDDDILVTRSLHHLYNVNIRNYAFAGTVQLNAGTAAMHLKDIIPLEHPGMEYNCADYINKGVTVINNTLWKKEHAYDNLVRVLRTYKLYFPEQDAMNVLFYGRTLSLDPMYAFFNSSFYTTVYSDEDKKPTLRALGREYCEALGECIKDPNRIISIHYAGSKCKPWGNLKTAMSKQYIEAITKYVGKVKSLGMSLIEK